MKEGIGLKNKIWIKAFLAVLLLFIASIGQTVFANGDVSTSETAETPTVPVSMELSKTSLTLFVSQSAQIATVIQPESAPQAPVTWTSSNAKVATVDTKGNIKAISSGTATVTAKITGDPSIQKSLEVTVSNILPASIKLNKSSLHITTKQVFKLTGVVSPSNATVKTLVWKSSDPKIATVDSNGNVKGIANGSATITATAKDNVKVFKTVTVKVAPKSVKVNRASLSLVIGASSTLTATVTPADSLDKVVTWKSSNPQIAVVDSKGKVTAKSKGTANVTATVKGAKVSTVKVTVTPPIAAHSVKLNKTSATLGKGKTLALTAAISPSTTTNKSVKWKSSNPKVATVDSKGKVTAVNGGTAKITVTTANGKVSTATITVPVVKSLSAGKWKGGTHLPAGRYKITTTSDFGNLFIGEGTDRYINEILSRPGEDFGVTMVTTDIKAGDIIEIMGLDKVVFTQVANVKSNTLHSGQWTVGKDINPGRYRVTTTSEFGNLFVERGRNLLVNEILANKPTDYAVTSVTTTLNSGDRISISGLDKVVFTKK